jgi:alpha/beta superfamily hydrolase
LSPEAAATMPDVIINGPEGRLEGRYHHAKDTSAPIALLLHPHPQHGGTMNNKVVYTLYHAFVRRGFSTLRFNFRGVGQSEGEFDNGQGEADDAVAAIRFLIAQKGVRADSAVLAGYSFGAMTAVRAAAGVEQVAAIVAVALPLGMIDPSALGAITKPIVLLAGDQDSYCPANHLAALAERLGPLARLKIIPGADHFFGGREHEITAALDEALTAL